LLIVLVKIEFRLDLDPEAEAWQALGIARDPADRGEMRQLLAAILFRRGDTDAAISLLRNALDDPAVPEVWRTRHRVLFANIRRSRGIFAASFPGDLSDMERAEQAAREMYEEAVAEGQRFEAAFALQTRWLLYSIRRDHERALGHVDDAIAFIQDDPSLASLHHDLLDNRAFSLQNLDRLEDAQKTLVSAVDLVARNQLPACLQVAFAVQYYWLGRWDEALAEVASVTVNSAPWVTYHGTRDPNAFAILLHGIGALIAARRGDLDQASAHLDAADAQLPGGRGPIGSGERESSDFELAAKALVAEQEGRVDDALALLAPLREPSYAPLMLRHQWLPDMVRLALSVGETRIAEEAAAVCADEAARETVPARAYAAALRCRALLSGDAEPALEAVRHYRDVGRRPELAVALEDGAVLLATAGRTAEATAAYQEAVSLLRPLRAEHDLARARDRLRAHDVEPSPFS
jgi:tetratricopeptide (TPR) repeat protein